MRFTGRVAIGPWGRRSKSARGHQPFLETDDGQRLRLRREGGNPMRDPALEELDGQTVVVEGELHGSLLIARSIARQGKDSASDV